MEEGETGRRKELLKPGLSWEAVGVGSSTYGNNHHFRSFDGLHLVTMALRGENSY